MSDKLAHVRDGSNDSQNKFSDEQIESREVYSEPKKSGFLGKTKRHCARFWWVHLIIFCISFLIIALCLVYVGMPKIAQSNVDDSSLEFTTFKFLAPSMKTVTLTQEGILHNPAKFTPTLDSFLADSYLVTNGTFGSAPLIRVQMPKIHATHPTSIAGTVDQQVPIVDIDQLTAFATAVIAQEYVETALVGKTDLHLGALPTVKINYNSTSKYKGLNGLAGFNVTDVRINAGKTDGPNLVGNAFIPNPSVMTIEMGNVTLQLRTAEQGVVGTTNIENFTIVPGDNVLPMTGTLNQTLILGSLTGGFATLLIKGTEVINAAGEHLTYYEKALGAHELTLKMNVQQVIADSLAH